MNIGELVGYIKLDGTGVGQGIRDAQAQMKTGMDKMAGEVRLTRLLLGLGLVNFSMHPAHLLEVKQRVLTSEVVAAKAIVDRIRRADNPDKIATLVDKLNAA